MNTFAKYSCAAALLGLATFGSLSLRAAVEREPTAAERSAAPVRALLLARPFLLERAGVHSWRAEQPTYDAGYLIVLEVDPEFVTARQTEEPVLYAGAETVERVSHAATSGHVVGIVPCGRGADGSPSLDLASTTFFFGPEALPDHIRASDAQHELRRAIDHGSRPFPAAEIAAALVRGGEILRVPSRDELDQRTALLVLEHAPEDADVGLGMLAPRVR
jgi:hypothetical protein